MGRLYMPILSVDHDLTRVTVQNEKDKILTITKQAGKDEIEALGLSEG